MQTNDAAIRHSRPRAFVQPWKAAADWLARFLDRLRPRRGNVGMPSVDDDWLQNHERESWKRGPDR